MPDRSEKRVLFVSYQFPPAGGGDALRVAKFVKFLPDHGWNCSVLTVANQSGMVTDESLSGEIPGETIIRRFRSLGSAPNKSEAQLGATSLLQPDPQILWRPFALRAGLRLLRETRHDAIIATGPPFSSHLLGATLSRRSGLPLVLEYRDEWNLHEHRGENGRRGQWTLHLQRAMQRSAIRQARALLATTPSSALHLAQTADQCGCKPQATWIYDGFDQHEFSSSGRERRTDYGHGTALFRMSYLGTLWNRSPVGPFVSGVRQLARERPELAERLELLIAGCRTHAQEGELDRLKGLPCKVVRLPFVSHEQAVRIMHESDSLLLLNADRPDAHRVVNSKVFEYMAARRPIFAVAPDGDVWDIIRDLPGTVLCPPCAEAAIAEALAGSIERHAAGVQGTPLEADITQYERQHLAGELAVLLDEVVDDRDVPDSPGPSPGTAESNDRQVVGL